MRDRRNLMALHRAAAVGSLPIVRLLIANKSPLNSSDVSSQTPLHHAMAEGHGDVVVELLRAGADQTRLDDDEKLWWELAPDQKVWDFPLSSPLTRSHPHMHTHRGNISIHLSPRSPRLPSYCPLKAILNEWHRFSEHGICLAFLWVKKTLFFSCLPVDGVPDGL